jgi:diguanylate cyclase (GGDEF)-like protein/PAS domain S-box-containing protein
MGGKIVKKRILLISLIIIAFFCFLPTAEAAPAVYMTDLQKLFDDSKTVVLVTDPEDGAILYANKAAADFYGYTVRQLQSMNIGQIDEQRNADEPGRPDTEGKTTHRLANGDVRTVEISSNPFKFNKKTALLSVVHDITENIALEAHHESVEAGVVAGGTAAIIILLALLGLLFRSNRSLSAAKKEYENASALLKTFLDADENMVYLKDENLRYVFVNKAFAASCGRAPEEIVGKEDAEILEPERAQLRTAMDRAALERRAVVEDRAALQGRVYRTTKFPVRMNNGKYGVGSYVADITEDHNRMMAQERMLKRNKILLDVITRSFKSTQEQLDYALHQLLELSGSRYGYIYLYDEDREEFTLNSWTRGVIKDCSVQNVPSVYPLADTGIWGEVVRQRKPIIVNDFAAPNPLKKGYPQGHVALTRYMSIPVFMDGKIVAVAGFGNKPTDYDDADIYEMTLLMSGVWNAVQRREAQENLAYERTKYLQTLMSIGDGVMVIDPDRNIEMLNGVACRLTGWTLEEAKGTPYKEVFSLTHEQRGFTVDDPIERVFETNQVQELGNHAVLTSKDGRQYYLEDSAAPITDDAGATVGVVLVFRDITDKKEQRKKIEYMSFHDSLTGLYNRRFFEEELLRLDTPRNLPISIVMGDVNSLKLTNDIFGHAFGDMLLEKVTEVMQKVCRADDIIARWGGDEFVILLPRTGPEDARGIVERIQSEVAKQQIRAIRGSLSIGFDTKRQPQEDIMQVLASAEARMYSAKTLERDEVRSRAFEAILQALFENGPGEEEHARRVGALCQKFGRTLGLPKVDVRRLKEAGRLHDIGKIVLDPGMLNRKMLTSLEWSEMSQHPIVGYRILHSFDGTLDLAEVVLAHHERWDGSGYPKGLRGEEIPLLARVISIVESYDRMVHNPDGSMAKSKEEALEEIIRCAGTQFDPALADAFVRMIRGNGR